MIIAAKSVEEHELTQVLQRAEERNITFNFEKMQLRVDEVKYLGTITKEGMKPDPTKVKAIIEATPTNLQPWQQLNRYY